MRERLPAIEVDPTFREATELAAQQNFLSLSAYIRLAVASQVRADGFDPHNARTISPMAARPAAPAGAGPLPAAAAAERRATA